MRGKGLKFVAALAASMTLVFLAGVLAAVDAIDLPGDWQDSLGLTEETPNPACRPGLYRNSPATPPAPAGRWRFEPETPRTQIEAGAIAIGPVVYVVGGSRPGNLHREEGEGWVTPSAWAIDPRTSRWKRLPDMAFARRAGGVAAANGRVYAIGGSYCAGLKPGGPVGTHTVESLPASAIGREDEPPRRG